MKAIKEEKDLYQSVKKYFEGLGFVGDGEVGDLDCVFKKDDTLIGVELKLRMNLDLILQGVRLLDLVDEAYIAIPRPKGHPKQREVKALLSRLGIGLLYVSKTCEVALPCHTKPRRASKSTRKSLIKELDSRYILSQTGGVSNKTKMTAYRQKCYLIAYTMKARGISKVSDIRDISKIKETGNVLRDNHYGWFERVSHGVYRLSGKFYQEMDEYKELEEYFKGENDNV